MLVAGTGAYAAQMAESVDAALSESQDAMKHSKKKKHRNGPTRDIKLIWANNRRKCSYGTKRIVEKGTEHLKSGENESKVLEKWWE